MMADERVIEIDSASYSSCLLQNYNKLRQNGKHCDFAIKAGKDVHYVHKTVLVVSSEYFRAMFDHDTAESRQGFVFMKEVDPSAVRKSVEFIYTGKASVKDVDIIGLIHVASLMQLEFLCEGIGKLLHNNITLESFYAAKKFASMYNITGLEYKCKEFASQHFKEVVDLDEFAGVDEDFILAVISSETTKVSDVHKYKALMKWINLDASNRRKCLPKLLSGLKLENLPVSFRKYIIENESSVYKSAKCMQILTASLLKIYGPQARNIDTSSQNAIAAISADGSSLLAYELNEQLWHEVCKLSGICDKNCRIVNIDDIVLMITARLDVYRIEYLLCRPSPFKISPRDSYGSYSSQSHGWYVAVHNRRVYAIGDLRNEDMRTAIFDLKTNKWNHVNTSGQCTKRQHFSLCASEDHILMIGGSINDSPSNVCDKLNTSDRSWQPIQSMSERRISPSSAHSNGKVYVVGGCIGHVRSEGIEVYDMFAESWTSLYYNPAAGYSISAVFVMDTFYVLDSSKIFEYEAGTNRWKERNCMKISHSNGCAAITF